MRRLRVRSSMVALFAAALFPSASGATPMEPLTGVGAGFVDMWPPHFVPLPCPLAERYEFRPHLMIVAATSLQSSAGDYAGPAVASNVWAEPSGCESPGLERGRVNSPDDPGTFAGSVTPGIAISGSFYGTYWRLDHVVVATLDVTYRTGFAQRTMTVDVVIAGLSSSQTSAFVTTTWGV